MHLLGNGQQTISNPDLTVMVRGYLEYSDWNPSTSYEPYTADINTAVDTNYIVPISTLSYLANNEWLHRSTGGNLVNSLVFTGKAVVVKRLERVRGKVRYELKNFRGDIRQVISDVKYREEVNGVVEYTADVWQVEDSYPFGWSIKDRSFTHPNPEESYRFGFNGKENDKDFGDQLIQDYGFRLYNPAIAKFLSVDPLAPEYPELTPYQFASNTPIAAIDLDGLEAKIAIAMGKDFNQNLTALKNEGYDTYQVNSGQEILNVINNYSGKDKIKELVIISHGYEGGIIGESVNSGIYTHAAMLDLGYEEMEYTYDIPSGMSEFAKKSTAYVGSLRIVGQGGASASMLATTINEVGFYDSESNCILGGCNLGIKNELSQFRIDLNNSSDFPVDLNEFPSDQIIDYQAGGFAGELAKMINHPVISSSGNLHGNDENKYQVTGRTQPYPKDSNSTTKRQGSTGGWTIFKPNGTDESLDENSSTIDLAKPK